MKTIPLAGLAFLALAACNAPPPGQPSAASAEDASLIADGRTVAEANCARCHALDDQTASPNAAAPPMKELLGRYDADMLANDLIEGIRVGHDDMPEFDLPVAAADALVAYLTSIRER